MKFLTMSSAKDAYMTLPPAISRQLLGAGLAWMKQKKQEGAILEMYTAGWNRYAVICQYDSADALIRALAEFPGGSLMNHEIYPLADFEATIKTMIESVKEAEKLFPAPA